MPFGLSKRFRLLPSRAIQLSSHINTYGISLLAKAKKAYILGLSKTTYNLHQDNSPQNSAPQDNIKQDSKKASRLVFFYFLNLVFCNSFR